MTMMRAVPVFIGETLAGFLDTDRTPDNPTHFTMPVMERQAVSVRPSPDNPATSRVTIIQFAWRLVASRRQPGDANQKRGTTRAWTLEITNYHPGGEYALGQLPDFRWLAEYLSDQAKV